MCGVVRLTDSPNLMPPDTVSVYTETISQPVTRLIPTNDIMTLGHETRWTYTTARSQVYTWRMHSH